VTAPDAVVERLLTSYDSITVVGRAQCRPRLIIEQRRLGLHAPNLNGQ
jgi:hypothetical protein